MKTSLSERDQSIEQLNNVLNKIKKEKNNLQIELDKTKSDLKIREGETSKLNFSLLECAHDLQVAKTDLAATISERDIALEDLQTQFKEREQLVLSHAAQIKSLQQDLEAAQQDLANAQNELAAVQTMFSEELVATQAMCSAEIEATKAKTLAEIGVIKAKYAAELHAIKEEHADELEASKAQVSFFKSKWDSTKAQLSFTKSKHEWAKADLSSIKSLLDAANHKCKSQAAELQAVKTELDKSIEMIAHRDGITSYIIQVYQEDIKNEKERLGAELKDKQEQLNKIKTTHEKEKKANAKTIKQLTNQVQNLTNQQGTVRKRKFTNFTF